MSNKLGSLVIAGAVVLAATEPALAADLFATAKTTIKENAGNGSGLYQAMTVAGLGAAGVGGYMTKNWVGAVGGFATGMIFTNTAMTMLGI